MSEIVSARRLKDNLGNTRIVDASWYMPDDKRDTKKEFEAGHIPGAVFFDIDGIADHATSLPHMLPSEEEFARAVGALGIGNDDRIVVYDSMGIFASPRVWWMFKAFGHGKVAVLDGGLPAWKEAGGALEKGAAKPKPAPFTAHLDKSMVRDFAQVKAGLGKAQILDARSAPRFEGSEPEPRPGLKSGHMPGAVNLPWRAVLNPDFKLKDDRALRKLFAEKGVDLRAPIITSCGSGISAAVVTLAAQELGAGNVALYDGSWADWGGRKDAPIATGP